MTTEDNAASNQSVAEHSEKHEFVGEIISSAEEDTLSVQLEAASTADQHADPHNAQHKEREDSSSSLWVAFAKGLDQHKSVEEKLQALIDFMDQSLSGTGGPHFKNFWEARKLCLQLFKENVNPVVRVALWNRYSDLSQQARRLKEILDEQTAFAVEQIEIAIKALETDIEEFQQHLSKTGDLEFPPMPKTLEDKVVQYSGMQKELALLNAHASRINALRKELIKTEMRIRHKNQFFQRLSAAGDKVFPRRKELIKEVSQTFINDVDQFISGCSSDETLSQSLFFVREEIKSFQGVAKFLTLNTHAFTHTRVRLSECWDRVKRLEREKKKEWAVQRESCREHAGIIRQKIQELAQGFQAGELTTAAANKVVDEIVTMMKNCDLGRKDLGELRDELKVARQLVLDKLRGEEQERQNVEVERERQKKERVQTAKNRVQQLVDGSRDMSAEAIVAEKAAVEEELAQVSLAKFEKQEIDRSLKMLRDIISDKKEHALLTLSDNDQQMFAQMKTVLKQRRERRKEIKEQLENLRKANGSSGFDISQAMENRTIVEAEKERLDKADEGIKEIELKIAELKRKI